MSLKDVFELSNILTGDDNERSELERKKHTLSTAVKQQEGRFIYEVEESQKVLEEVEQLAQYVVYVQSSLREKFDQIILMDNDLHHRPIALLFLGRFQTYLQQREQLAEKTAGIHTHLAAVEQSYKYLSAMLEKGCEQRKLRNIQKILTLEHESIHHQQVLDTRLGELKQIQCQTQFFLSHQYEVEVEIMKLSETIIIGHAREKQVSCDVENALKQKENLIDQLHLVEQAFNECKEATELLIKTLRESLQESESLCREHTFQLEEASQTHSHLTSDRAKLLMTIDSMTSQISHRHNDLTQVTSQLTEKKAVLNQLESDLVIQHTQESTYRTHSFDDKIEHLSFEAENMRSIVLELQDRISYYHSQKQKDATIVAMKKAIEDCLLMQANLRHQLQKFCQQASNLADQLSRWAVVEAAKRNDVVTAMHTKHDVLLNNKMLAQQIASHHNLLTTQPSESTLFPLVLALHQQHQRISSRNEYLLQVSRDIQQCKVEHDLTLQRKQDEWRVIYGGFYQQAKKNRLSKAKISAEQQHRVLENKKQQEVMEKDKEFQESIQTKQRELIKKKDHLHGELQSVRTAMASFAQSNNRKRR